MFLRIFWNLLQQRLCLTLYYSQLEQHCGVEHRIGILLKWENPLILSCPNTWPATDCFLSTNTTILVIADNTAQQAVISGWNIVMIIEQNSSQSRSINAENLIVRNLRCQFWIQCVNTLNHQHFVTLQLQLLSTPLALAFLEIIARQFYLFAPEQSR